MKNKMKVLSVITIVLMLAMSTVCFAGDLGIDFEAKPIGGMQNFANGILGAFQWIGIIIAVGILIFMGIKYMSQGAEGKSEIKKSLGMYVLGLVFVIGALAIVTALKAAVPNIK